LGSDLQRTNTDIQEKWIERKGDERVSEQILMTLIEEKKKKNTGALIVELSSARVCARGHGSPLIHPSMAFSKTAHD
jgi:hypothetical protein